MSPDEYTKIRTYFKNILPDDLDDEIINATDVALIASWIDKKKGTPYYFKDLPLKFNLIYRASRDCFRIDLYIKSSGSFINNIVGKSKQHPYEKKIINRETFKIEEYEVFQVIIDNRLSTLILIRVQKIFKKSFNIIKRFHQKNRWRNDLEYHNKKSFLSQANKIFKCGQGLSNIEERLEKPLCMNAQGKIRRKDTMYGKYEGMVRTAGERS
ncbi:hypothetical protein GLOIN_2v1872981 [Rhizophagus irregularis DAOM 181602=DAOM 197198]|uniref:Uncharacterized protein n=1 Tax=Rhizophagus irregularis (strain DAOM 181602 / DAOM 197198 / MUCL 43194) TaxID=747089 RepID=A0A2P4QCF4_RHIID|nr:hypothetical protein GLOIN_2v1872981 [Rhizophagus irregularis DAOM 181602=DAOM 197198]POG75321.1 hypothetical protein GLOIN_2v1872981 [Rhizophagus irregularis DAOM 181602=DAOM 197198]|eukprot:XP_025182187.1 hypothetical protein GLOIN_2v1872981 [Rhizophagus irregularis DAOM 181602=DAOM 197198]